MGSISLLCRASRSTCIHTTMAWFGCEVRRMFEATTVGEIGFVRYNAGENFKMKDGQLIFQPDIPTQIEVKAAWKSNDK